MKISKERIKKEQKCFDGTCPFIEKNTECSLMSYSECNKCDVSKDYRKYLIKEIVGDWALDYIPAPLYRIPSQISSFFYEIKYIFQKSFRKNHTSDKMLWGLDYTFAYYIYPKLLAFRTLPRMGIPMMYSEYSEDEGWTTKEEYDKHILSGEMVGGGEEKWNNDLDEMLFAMEYIILDNESGKRDKQFYKKWDIENPHEEKESNKREGFLGKEPFYYNTELAMKYGERAQKGLELFGKRFWNLWD